MKQSYQWACRAVDQATAHMHAFDRDTTEDDRWIAAVLAAVAHREFWRIGYLLRQRCQP